eukprot:2310756-Pleurochrysis_carterae.AAC.1
MGTARQAGLRQKCPQEHQRERAMATTTSLRLLFRRIQPCPCRLSRLSADFSWQPLSRRPCE